MVTDEDEDIQKSVEMSISEEIVKETIVLVDKSISTSHLHTATESRHVPNSLSAESMDITDIDTHIAKDTTDIKQGSNRDSPNDMLRHTSPAVKNAKSPLTDLPSYAHLRISTTLDAWVLGQVFSSDDILKDPEPNGENTIVDADVAVDDIGAIMNFFQLLALTVCFLGVQFAWTVEMAYGSPFLIDLGLPKYWMSLVWIAGPVSGLIAQPIFGSLSDNCRSRLGKRRPFIIGGTCVTIASMILIGHAKNIGNVVTNRGMNGTAAAITAAVIGFWMMDFSINVIMTGARALISDIVSVRQVETANAFASFLVGIGNITGYFTCNLAIVHWLPFFDSQMQGLCYIASLILGLCILITCLAISENNPRKKQLYRNLTTPTSSVTDDSHLSSSEITESSSSSPSENMRIAMKSTRSNSQDHTYELNSTHVPKSPKHSIQSQSSLTSSLQSAAKESRHIEQEIDLSTELQTSDHPEQHSLIAALKRVAHLLCNLSSPFKELYAVQFFSWMGWFPFLFYITTWMAEDVYVAPPSSSGTTVSSLLSNNTLIDNSGIINNVSNNSLRRSSISAAGSSTMNILALALNHHKNPSAVQVLMRRMGGGNSPSSRDGITDEGVRWGAFALTIYSLVSLVYTVILPWLNSCIGVRAMFMFSQLLFGLTMLLTNTVTHHVVFATILVAICGISWATTMVTPFTLSAQYSTPNEAGGLRLGILNIFVVIPQLVTTLLATIIFKITAKHGLRVLLTFAGIAGLVAAGLVYFIQDPVKEGQRMPSTDADDTMDEMSVSS